MNDNLMYQYFCVRMVKLRNEYLEQSGRTQRIKYLRDLLHGQVIKLISSIFWLISCHFIAVYSLKSFGIPPKIILALYMLLEQRAPNV